MWIWSDMSEWAARESPLELRGRIGLPLRLYGIRAMSQAELSAKAFAFKNGHRPSLAEDLLEGVPAITEYIYGRSDKTTQRKVLYQIERGYLPTFKSGGKHFARRSQLDAHFSSDRTPEG